MASVKLNPSIVSLRGKVRDLVFKRFMGREIVACMPDFKERELSDAEKALRENFRLAAGYGRKVMSDNQTRKIYETAAKSRNQPVFSVIMEDFLRYPRVDAVDLTAYSGGAGEKIFVTASDDFEVVAVRVAISKESGEPVEAGAAVQSADDSGQWLYTTTSSVPPGTPVKVAVSVTDRPRHTVTRTEGK